MTSPAAAVAVLRVLGLLEGTSYLLLLGIAMPLKYLAGQPAAVHYVGWAHGLLFMLLLLAVAYAWARGLSTKLAFAAAVASLLPAGPFFLEPRLRRAQAHLAARIR